MAVTMHEIAKYTGLSRQTVGLALSEKAHLLRLETRTRVVEAAKELGYRPNSSALAMKTGRFGCVGLLQSKLVKRSYLPPDLADGIHEALLSRDLHLTVARLPDEILLDEEFVPKIMRQWTCDGLLIDYITDIPYRLFDLIAKYRIPSIWINAKTSADCVHPDDFGAAKQATQRLLELGHRRIAYLRCSPGYPTRSRHFSEIDRRDGYMSAMQAAGLQPRLIGDGQVVPRSNSVEFVKGFLMQPDRPTALVTYHFEEPGPVLLAAAMLGLCVPRDLSLVSFSGEVVDTTGVAVATMLIPERELGIQAVEMLMQKVQTPSRALDPCVLPLRLDEGATLALASAV